MSHVADAHGDNSLFRPGSATAIEAQYVDLSALLASVPDIDLLKCDIEGAELLFIQNYRDVLQRVRVAIFELHDELCDTERCRQLLREYGFSHERMIRQTGPYSIHCVWR